MAAAGAPADPAPVGGVDFRTESEPKTALAAGAEAVPGELIVTWNDDVAPAAAAGALAAPGADPAGTTGDATLVVTEPGQEAQVAADLAADPRVEVVEPNLVRHLAWTPTDPKYGGTSGQHTSYDAIRLRDAWNRSRGRGVRVAVIDSGIDPNHPDLKPNIVHVSSTAGDAGVDGNGHGTMVAGIIAAAGNNGVGGIGVAPQADLISIKVFRGGSASDFDIAQAIDRAIQLDADIINMSLGGAGISRALDNALRRAAANHVLTVVAAGNEYTAARMYPAAHDKVLAVGAVGDQGILASFSNHGPNVDITAPGVGITSTLPGGRYATWAGTSFASPMVAGVAALVKEERPGLRGLDLAALLTRTAADAGAPGDDPAFGAGIVDAAAAIGIRSIRPVSRPAPRGGALDDFPAGAHPIVEHRALERIDPEYDEDWFYADLPGPRRLSVTLRAPRSTNLLEMDAVLEVYNSKLRRLTIADRYYDRPEQAVVRVPAGRVYMRVTNWAGSQSPGRYELRTRTDPIVGDFTHGQQRAMWARRVTPGNRASDLAHKPVITAQLSPIAQEDADRFRLSVRHGRTGETIASTRLYDASTGVLRARVNDHVGSGVPIAVWLLYRHPTDGHLVIDKLNYAIG